MWKAMIISNNCRSSFKHFDYLMSNALKHRDQCGAIFDCPNIGKDLIDHKILKNDNMYVYLYICIYIISNTSMN